VLLGYILQKYILHQTKPKQLNSRT
jgi:hypothetical protein